MLCILLEFFQNPLSTTLRGSAIFPESKTAKEFPQFCEISVRIEILHDLQQLRIGIGHGEGQGLQGEIEIPIPDIEIQKSIASIYSVYIKRREINEQLKAQMKDICPVLIRGSLEE